MTSKDDMFLRFVVGEIDHRSGREKGIFSIAYDILRLDQAPEYELNEIKKSLFWLETHLPAAKKFSRKKNIGDKNTQGISWIKSDANEIVKRLYELKDIIERHGYQVEVIKTQRPGYIVYEDRFQIVAEPFRES
ncbi:MAG: hypothetical protein M9899_07020 [Bdellovibrionaceae bacterium]|nr:hypothetical protein [Pseudobdellovibrionaceae bacterium]